MRLLLAVLLAVLVHPAAPRAEAAGPSLAAVTTITAERTASIAVRLPRPATLRDPLFADGAAGDLRISTTGRFGAVVLAQQGVPERQRVIVVGARAPGRPGLHFTYAVSGLTGGGSFRVPAGDYRLYAVSERGPVTITMRLVGLSGTTRLTADQPARAGVQLPAAALDTTPARVAYAVGQDRRTSGRTMFLSVLSVAYQAHIDTAYVHCFYFARPSGPAPYHPGCPDNTERLITTISLPPDAGAAVRHLVVSSVVPLEGGHYAAGVSLTSVTPAEMPQYAQLWLEY